MPTTEEEKGEEELTQEQKDRARRRVILNRALKKEAKKKEELAERLDSLKKRRIEGGIVKINIASFKGNIKKLEEEIGALEELEAEIMTFLYDSTPDDEQSVEKKKEIPEKDKK